MDIVFIGDSLTYGYGVTKETSWVTLLTRDMSLKYLNKGVNGDTTVGMLSRFYQDVILNNPTYCFIFGGTNDLLIGRNLTTVYDNLLLMVRDCIDHQIIPVLLIPPYIAAKQASSIWSSSIDYNLINMNLEILKKQLKIYKPQIITIDLFTPTQYVYSKFKDIYLDGIHLNIKGHVLIHHEIKKVFNPK